MDNDENDMDMPKEISCYKIGKFLYSYRYYKIYVGINSLTKEEVTIKTIKKKYVKGNGKLLTFVNNEILYTKLFSHNNILKFLEAHETPLYIFIIMENFQGELLSSYMKRNVKLEESKALTIFTKLISAMNYIHNMNVCHLNITLDSILIDENSEHLIKIFDFKFSVYYYAKFKTFSDNVGINMFTCPEMLTINSYYPELADVWSCGILLCYLLIGDYPVNNDEEVNIEERYSVPDNINEDLHDLIKNMLYVDVDKRYRFDDIINSKYFVDRNYNNEIMEENVNNINIDNNNLKKIYERYMRTKVNLGRMDNKNDLINFDILIHRELLPDDQRMSKLIERFESKNNNNNILPKKNYIKKNIKKEKEKEKVTVSININDILKHLNIKDIDIKKKTTFNNFKFNQNKIKTDIKKNNKKKGVKGKRKSVFELYNRFPQKSFLFEIPENIEKEESKNYNTNNKINKNYVIQNSKTENMPPIIGQKFTSSSVGKRRRTQFAVVDEKYSDYNIFSMINKKNKMKSEEKKENKNNDKNENNNQINENNFNEKSDNKNDFNNKRLFNFDEDLYEEIEGTEKDEKSNKIVEEKDYDKITEKSNDYKSNNSSNTKSNNSGNTSKNSSSFINSNLNSEEASNFNSSKDNILNMNQNEENNNKNNIQINNNNNITNENQNIVKYYHQKTDTNNLSAYNNYFFNKFIKINNAKNKNEEIEKNNNLNNKKNKSKLNSNLSNDKVLNNKKFSKYNQNKSSDNLLKKDRRKNNKKTLNIKQKSNKDKDKDKDDDEYLPHFGQKSSNFENENKNNYSTFNLHNKNNHNGDDSFDISIFFKNNKEIEDEIKEKSTKKVHFINKKATKIEGQKAVIKKFINKTKTPDNKSILKRTSIFKRNLKESEEQSIIDDKNMVENKSTLCLVNKNKTKNRDSMIYDAILENLKNVNNALEKGGENTAYHKFMRRKITPDKYLKKNNNKNDTNNVSENNSNSSKDNDENEIEINKKANYYTINNINNNLNIIRNHINISSQKKSKNKNKNKNQIIKSNKIRVKKDLINTINNKSKNNLKKLDNTNDNNISYYSNNINRNKEEKKIPKNKNQKKDILKDVDNFNFVNNEYNIIKSQMNKNNNSNHSKTISMSNGLGKSNETETDLSTDERNNQNTLNISKSKDSLMKIKKNLKEKLATESSNLGVGEEKVKIFNGNVIDLKYISLKNYEQTCNILKSELKRRGVKFKKIDYNSYKCQKGIREFYVDIVKIPKNVFYYRFYTKKKQINNFH